MSDEAYVTAEVAQLVAETAEVVDAVAEGGSPEQCRVASELAGITTALSRAWQRRDVPGVLALLVRLRDTGTAMLADLDALDEAGR